MLEHLLREKLLDYVAIDIKNAPARYAETCGADVIEQVKKSAALLKNSNINYEFRKMCIRDRYTSSQAPHPRP